MIMDLTPQFLVINNMVWAQLHILCNYAPTSVVMDFMFIFCRYIYQDK